jgi:hypothetical protein
LTRDEWIAASDEMLLRSSSEDFYRASGPGGQKRNKTESAVRLRHPETGLIVVAVESRSRQENRERAVKRLREAIANKIRVDLKRGEIPLIVQSVATEGFKIGKKDVRFLPLSAALLDMMVSYEGKVSELADALGLATAKVVNFLRTTPELWEETQHLRDRFGLGHLH